MGITHRRDSFCGRDVRLQQPAAVRHSLFADNAAYRHAGFGGIPKDLEWFAAVCRVVNGLRNLRIGALGAGRRRSTRFATARNCSKRSGISVETLDLSEVLGRIGRMKDKDEAA